MGGRSRPPALFPICTLCSSRVKFRPLTTGLLPVISRTSGLSLLGQIPNSSPSSPMTSSLSRSVPATR
jgi:hypothetical protein